MVNIVKISLLISTLFNFNAYTMDEDKIPINKDKEDKESEKEENNEIEKIDVLNPLNRNLKF